MSANNIAIIIYGLAVFTKVVLTELFYFISTFPYGSALQESTFKIAIKTSLNLKIQTCFNRNFEGWAGKIIHYSQRNRPNFTSYS